MSRGQFDRRRQMSPFVFAVIVMVCALIAVCAIVVFLAPARVA